MVNKLKKDHSLKIGDIDLTFNSFTQTEYLYLLEVKWQCEFERSLEDPESPESKFLGEFRERPKNRLNLQDCLRG